MIYDAIPDLSQLREIKDSYPAYPIDKHNLRYKEEVVPISAVGIRGSSYYSQPNKMTGEPLPGINPEALVRVSVAEKLEAANREIKTSKDIAKLMGAKVEIIVRDALRSAELQKHLFNVVWPQVLKEMNPEWSREKIKEELPNFIAKPQTDTSSPTPHMTGGAVDINLVYRDGSAVDFGHVRGKRASLTDYYEDYDADEERPVSTDAQLARRILYWTMNEQDLMNNPTEWWHYS